MAHMQIDFKISTEVDLAEAYMAVAGARGFIAMGLREQAMIMAEYNVMTARGHKATKRARDVRRQLRRLEIKRRGWR